MACQGQGGPVQYTYRAHRAPKPTGVSVSAWPKMCRDPAHPAVAVAQRGDGVPAVQSESLTLLRRDGIEMIPDFSYIKRVPAYLAKILTNTHSAFLARPLR